MTEDQMDSTTTKPPTSKVRVVCISDTHNQTPSLPSGDILIHAGDLTNNGSHAELKRQLTWLSNTPFEQKIVVAGNHDLTLDAEFYAQHCGPGGKFEGKGKEDVEQIGKMFRECPGITYLCHEETTIVLKRDGTTIRVFGSPLSLRQGVWAFGYEPDEAQALWAEVPESIDILITHGPPKGVCDTARSGDEGGCPAIRSTLGRVRPRLHVCGHRHEGRGCQIVHWSDPYSERGLDRGNAEIVRVSRWLDPGRGNGKMSLVDLTGRKGMENWVDDGVLGSARLRESSHTEAHLVCTGVRQPISDRAATCVVNCAIKANSFGGPSQFNKPIVVDIDLPISTSD